jgi:hypothetical protein
LFNDVTAANDGLVGQPRTRIEDNLYTVGDWVGSEALLSNASFASATEAAQLILNELGQSSKVRVERPSTFDALSS